MNKQLEYLNNKGATCPNCSSNDISALGTGDFDLTEATQDVECEHCGATWTDVFTLTGFTSPDVPHHVYTVLIDRNTSDTDPFWDVVEAENRADAVRKACEFCADADGIVLMGGYCDDDRNEYIEGLRIVAVIKGKAEFVL